MRIPTGSTAAMRAGTQPCFERFVIELSPANAGPPRLVVDIDTSR